MIEINEIIHKQTEIDLHLKWRRDTPNQCYYLDFDLSGCGRQKGIQKIWNQVAGGYGVLSGHSYRTLKEAKVACMGEVKQQLVTLFSRMNEHLVSGSQDPFLLSLFEKKTLDKIIDAVFAGQNEDVIELLTKEGLPTALRSENNRFGNALAAFDIGTTMFSLLESRTTYRYRDGVYVINCQSIGITLVADNLSGGRNSAFGDDGWLFTPYNTITTKALYDALAEGLCQVAALESAAAA